MSESPPTAESAANAADYCAGRARTWDRDRYLAALLAPRGARPALMALLAFNLEIAKVRETVSEPMLGQIRLEWWREALDGIYGGSPRQHAVTLALGEAVARHDLSRTRFERMIDGREFDLENRQPADMKALLAYAGATSGELSCLALEALGVRHADAMAAAHDTGVAWALVGLLRAVPFHAVQRRCYLPQSATAAAGLELGALYEGGGEAARGEAAAPVATTARDILDRLDRTAASVPRAARPALLPRHLARIDLDRLARVGHDPFRVRPAGPVYRQLRLMLGRVAG